MTERQGRRRVYRITFLKSEKFCISEHLTPGVSDEEWWTCTVREIVQEGRGHVCFIGERRNAFRIVVGKAEWTKWFWRRRRRLESNIKINLKSVGYVNFYFAQDRYQRWWFREHDNETWV